MLIYASCWLVLPGHEDLFYSLEYKIGDFLFCFDVPLSYFF